MVVRFYSSVAPETTLSGGITSGTTSITVGSVVGFPANTPYTLALDYEGATEELVQVNIAAGTTLTVTRAVDGTSATSHNAGARVRHVSSARDFADSRTHENSDQGIHGLAPGDTLVGEDAVQTLTNKTLDSPILNTATANSATLAGTTELTGTLHGPAIASSKIRLDNSTDVSPTSSDHAFQIGPTTGANLRMDGNEIMGANNGATSAVGLQSDGGTLSAFINVAADSVANAFNINGVANATQHQSTRPGATTTTYSSRITGDTNSRWLSLANGTNQWGPGNTTADTTLARTAVGGLTLTSDLTVTNSVTSPNATHSGTVSLGTATATNLTVTGTFSPPQTTASGATVGAVGSGWSLASLNGMKVGGSTYITLVVNRTGPTITPETSPPTGNITDSTLVTLTTPWRPSPGYNVAISATCTDGISHGAARLNTDGTLDLLTWMPGVLIGMGDPNNYRVSISFPSN